MINEKNATYLFVGNVTTGVADGAALTPAVIDALPAGSVVIADYSDLSSGIPTAKESEALAAGGIYEMISKLADGTIVRSPKFNFADIVETNYAAYVQPTEQVSFLGYDGTTINGLGTITLGDSCIVGLWLNHTKGTYSQQGEVKHISAYATDTLQATVAKNLMESHLKNFSSIREKNPTILCDRIARVDSVAAHDTATIAYLVNGSKTVTVYTKTVAASAALTASTTTIAAATVINIPSCNGRSFSFTATAEDHVIYIGTTSYVVADDGDPAANSTAIAAAINAGTQATAVAAGAGVTTITYLEGTRALPPMIISDADGAPATVAVTIATGDAVPVQYVVSATATAAATYTLDESWQGPTGYVYTGTTAATHIGESTLNAANAWGLKFTGVKQPFNPQVDEPTQVNFDVLTDSFGTYGAEYKAVKPTKGHGTYAQMSALEAYTQGNENWARNSMYPSVTYRREITDGYAYNVATLVAKPSVTSAATGISVASPFTLVVATKSGLTAPAIATILA